MTERVPKTKVLTHAQQQELDRDLERTEKLDRQSLKQHWRKHYGRPAPAKFPRSLLVLGISYKLQERVYGGLRPAVLRQLLEAGSEAPGKQAAKTASLSPGTVLIRDWRGVRHTVTIIDKGALYEARTYASLTAVARLITGTHQSGPIFFGVTKRQRNDQPAE